MRGGELGAGGGEFGAGGGDSVLEGEISVPHREKDWQQKPAVSRSWGGTLSVSTSVMSPTSMCFSPSVCQADRRSATPCNNSWSMWESGFWVWIRLATRDANIDLYYMGIKVVFMDIRT
eukprot:1194096-Prorocentrum_minimum.AAC.4